MSLFPNGFPHVPQSVAGDLWIDGLTLEDGVPLRSTILTCHDARNSPTGGNIAFQRRSCTCETSMTHEITTHLITISLLNLARYVFSKPPSIVKHDFWFSCPL